MEIEVPYLVHQLYENPNQLVRKEAETRLYDLMAIAPGKYHSPNYNNAFFHAFTYPSLIDGRYRNSINNTEHNG